LSIGVTRPAKNLSDRAGLNDTAEIHDDDTVADVPDDIEVVRDENVGQVEIPPQIGKQVEDLRFDRFVERRYRFVEDQEARFGANARAMLTRCRWPPESS
jgi:hypothetical protein